MGTVRKPKKVFVIGIHFHLVYEINDMLTENQAYQHAETRAQQLAEYANMTVEQIDCFEKKF